MKWKQIEEKRAKRKFIKTTLCSQEVKLADLRPSDIQDCHLQRGSCVRLINQGVKTFVGISSTHEWLMSVEITLMLKEEKLLFRWVELESDSRRLPVAWVSAQMEEWDSIGSMVLPNSLDAPKGPHHWDQRQFHSYWPLAGVLLFDGEKPARVEASKQIPKSRTVSAKPSLPLNFTCLLHAHWKQSWWKGR